MHKLFSLIFVAILFLASCENNEIKETDKSRGALVSEPVKVSTITTKDMEALIKIIGNGIDLPITFTNDMDLYKIAYYTIDNDGEATQASGLLILPNNASAAVPLLSYQHGTALSKGDVPSRQKSDYTASLLFAATGYAVACPDYLGLGDSPGLHPYVHSKTEATAVIDMLRASKKVCANKSLALSEQIFLLGYSQGGHATMAALKAIEEQHAQEFKIAACAAMAGPYDLSGTQMNYIMCDTTFASPGYLPYVIFAYNAVYKLFPNLENIFGPQYYPSLAKMFAANTTYTLSEVDALWPKPAIPSAILQPAFVADFKENPAHPLRTALKENDLYNWKPQSPVLLCHCDSDMHVPYQNSEVAYQSFISKGATQVTFINPLPGGNHYTCAIPSFIAALKWLETKKE